MKLNLFQIESEYLQLADILIEAGGETTPELETMLLINKEHLQVKAAGYAFVIKDKDAEIEAIDKEIDRLNGLKKVRENAKQRLKDAIKNAMQLYGVDKIESNTITITLAKSPASVSIEDENLIPEVYKKSEVKTSILKKEIANDLKAGYTIPGASLITDNKSLRIS